MPSTEKQQLAERSALYCSTAQETHTRSTHALTDLLKHSHTENLEMESRNGGQDLWFSFNLIWFLPSHLSLSVGQHYNFMPTEDLSHSFFFFLNVTVPSESKPQVTSLPSQSKHGQLPKLECHDNIRKGGVLRDESWTQQLCH